jgi:hypothetical protein
MVTTGMKVAFIVPPELPCNTRGNPGRPDYRGCWNPQKAMKPEDTGMSALVTQVARAESKLQELEWEIADIGQPAGHELLRRLDALKTEERALQRNLAALLEADHPDDGRRLEKIRALLDHIAREESSLRHDADFLHQSGRTSAEFATRAASVFVSLVLGAVKRVVGDRHPLGMSVFVNHSHRTLAEQYGLAAPEGDGGAKSGG